jgi:hypothetical protein
MPNFNQLFLNDNPVDLPDSEAMGITYQVNDLATLADRQSTFSNTIKLPKTQRNRKELGFADSDAFTQIQPYRILSARLEQSGIQTIPNGNFSLLRVNNNFEGQITFGYIGFLDKLKTRTTDGSLKDTKLSDLDWSDIPNFFRTLDNIVDSQSGVGVLWPVVDYGGTLTASAVINASYLRPGVYFSQIFERIERYTGYKLLGGRAWTTGFNDFIPFSQTELARRPDFSIRMEDNMPNFTVKEFLKDYMQRYFLTPVVDNFLNTVTFRSFDELYANINNAKDWTKKFLNDGREDSFSLTGYAQNNNLLFTEDSQVAHGDGVILIDDTTLPFTKDIMTSIWTPSTNIPNLVGGHTISQIRKFESSPLPNFGTDFTIDTKPRILRIQSANGIYGFQDASTTQYTSTGVKIGYFYDWSYYIANFGQGLLKMLTKTRIITRYANLTPLDVKDFDFFTPIYDALEGKYYYVNKISNFTGGRTSVSLVRL